MKKLKPTNDQTGVCSVSTVDDIYIRVCSCIAYREALFVGRLHNGIQTDCLGCTDVILITGPKKL